MLTMFLRLSSLGLDSVADFSNTEAQGSILKRILPLLIRMKGNAFFNVPFALDSW